MNIYDIAQLAGVSIATVSRVVNGSNKVSDKTKQKVLDVINAQGYTPNVFAQGLGLNTMHTIGILVPSISDLYMSNAVAATEEQLQTYGYDCILGCSGFDLARKKEHVQMLLSKRIDGLILIGSTYASNGENVHDTDYIREAAQSVPVFVINGAVAGDNVYCTVSDDRAATYEVTDNLIRKGCKRILFLSDSQSYSAQQKLAGYEAALTDHGLPVLGELKLHVQNRIHIVRDLLLQYKDLQFDAVVATDDAMAVGAIKYAGIKGLRIPQDLQIVGYNNSVLSIGCEPELTSIDTRVEQICRDTVDRLFRILQNKDEQEVGAEHKVIVPCRLVKRSTTDF